MKGDKILELTNRLKQLKEDCKFYTAYHKKKI